MEANKSHSYQEIDTSSDSEKTASCGACLSAGENRPAVKFCLDCSQPICQQCVDAHGRINSIRNHKLVETVDDESAKLAELLSSCLSCASHPEKNVELVCKDHDVMCCITCVTVGHRNCRDVSEIASEAKALIASTKVQDVSKHLNAAKSHIEEVITVHRKHNEMVEAQREVNIPIQVQKVKRRVIEILDALEKRVHLETDALALRETARGLVEIEKWESFMKNIIQNIDALEMAQRSDSNMHVYVIIHNIRKTLTKIDRVLADLGNRIVRRSVIFEEGKALKDMCIFVNNERKSLNFDETAIPANLTHVKDTVKATKVATEEASKTGFAFTTCKDSGLGLPQAVIDPNFGQPAVPTTCTHRAVFGQAPQNPQGGLFGQAPQNPQIGLFGQAPKMFGQAPQNPQSGLFDQAPKMFGQAPQNPQRGLFDQAPQMFGQAPQNPQKGLFDQAPQMFGQAPQNSQRGLFDQAPQIFGQAPQSTQDQTQKPVVPITYGGSEFSRAPVEASRQVVTSTYGGSAFGQTPIQPQLKLFGQASTPVVTSSYGGSALGQASQAIGAVQNPLVLASVNARDADYQLPNYQFK